MLVNQFDELLSATPFQPFRIYTSDGRSVTVRSREFAWHPPASRIAWVASDQADDRVHMIDLHLVTRFTVNPRGRGGNGSRRRRPR
jgi:hypothetical protein